MTDVVKPKRAYRSTRRAEQVAEKRRGIVEAADARFRAAGYSPVTMPEIAREAGVAVETDLSGVRKQGRPVRGGHRRGCGRRSGTCRAPGRGAARDPGDHRGARPAPPGRALRRRPNRASTAAPGNSCGRSPRPPGSDPELRALWDGDRDPSPRRSSAVRRDAGRPWRPRPGLSVEEGRDGLWTLTSLAVHDMLVVRRGWPVERYERWLANALAGLLLPG